MLLDGLRLPTKCLLMNMVNDGFVKGVANSWELAQDFGG